VGFVTWFGFPFLRVSAANPKPPCPLPHDLAGHKTKCHKRREEKKYQCST